MMTVLVLVVFGFMLAEAQRAASNERAQLARGGIEPPGDVYRTMQFVYPAAFVAMFAEGLENGYLVRNNLDPTVGLRFRF